MPKQTLILDSSQLTTYLECPTLWDYSYRQSISKLEAQPNDAISMGTYGHRLLDIYYKCIAKGCDMSSAIDAALKFNPDWETCTCGLPIEEHPQVGEGCITPTPKPFPLNTEQKKLVKERFSVHCYTYNRNDFVPASSEHIEVGFSHKLYEDNEKLYVLEGRIDGIGTFSGQPAIIDHKFQMRRRDLYKKSIQFRNYSLVTDMNLLIINYIRLTKEVTKDTYSRQIASFSELERNWWRGEVIKVFDKVALETSLCECGHRQKEHIYLSSEDNVEDACDILECTCDKFTPKPLEKRWDSCSGKFGYPCQYTDLCEEISPEIVQVKKQNLYQPKPVWKPW